ncbi:amidohydrolase [Kangiella sp. HZ709]|uniref:amidohydrolase n=1 Tax=Kangiella sp. HZ709 TaxID=2666328 RepID=UPI0021056245|nr:amidohydrolase [Kangiella sp. HZ709]
MMNKKRINTILLGAFCSVAVLAPTTSYAKDKPKLSQSTYDIESKVVEWRRHIHENPELSNREFETAKYITKHLKSLGLEIQTEVAHTGVIAILKGAKPGPVVALRADMDALPVKERTPVSFASKVMAEYNGEQVPVMHACGHDTHVAILMGVAEVLTGMQNELAGTVKFIFQPAEEGSPVGEEGGAELMVKEGVLENPKVDVVFGLHISSGMDVGTIGVKPEGIMAGVDDMKITIKGKQSHGSTPWNSVDPIVTSAQIINGLQTVVSRHMHLTNSPAVVTIGSIHSGVRSNIIPEKLEMLGTVRTFSQADKEKTRKLITEKAELIGKSMNAKVEVQIPYSSNYPVTFNNVALTQQMLPTLESVVEKVNIIKPITGAEDFSFFAKEVPGLYFFLGGKPKDTPASEAAAHHTPDFFIDESGMKYGVEALTQLTLDYMKLQQK